MIPDPDLHTMHVRLARADDHAPLLELWERSVRATHDFLQESDIDALRPLVAQELSGGAIEWWVLASEHDAAIGFMGFANDTIEALFLDPQHRGMGGGTRLIAHAQHRARGRPLSVDVNEQNPAAQKFYESQGFRVVARSETDSGGRPFPILHMKRPS